MKKHAVTIGLVVLVLVGAGWFQFVFKPSRFSPAVLAERKEAADMIAQAEEKTPETEDAAEKPTKKEDTMQENLPDQAPDTFKVAFECSNGTFVVQCHKDWAPLGVQRFYELVKTGFYNDARFFRVVPGFVVQFGLAGDPAEGAEWFGSEFKDDPVTKTNKPGTLSFATRGPNTRTTQIFINLGNNAQLDDMDFAPFAEVTEGFDVVKDINAEYGQQPDQGMIRRMGNEYLEKEFPNMDYIKQATVILPEAEDVNDESPADAPAQKKES
ncbi:MAG: peptidylprolyl isomerase [Candidatus Hydrogenedentota bacterium]